jgi:hypothetical protein
LDAEVIKGEDETLSLDCGGIAGITGLSFGTEFVVDRLNSEHPVVSAEALLVRNP